MDRAMPRLPLTAKPPLLLALALAIGSLMPAAPGWAQPGDAKRLVPAGAGAIVSAAVRRRGHACNGEVHAERLAGPVTAHRRDWQLTCGHVRYRVTFVLDRMVSIDRVD